MRDHLQYANPRRVLFWLITSALMLWIVSRDPLARFTSIAISGDFMGYWTSTRLFLAHLNPYDPGTVSTFYAQYGRSISPAYVTWAPPWIYLVLSPFALLGIATASFLWFALSCTLILLFANYVWRCHGGLPEFRPYVILSALLFPPCALALNLGQTSPLVLGGLLGFFWALRKGHFFVAGLSTYLLMAKPHVAYLFWYFLALWILANRSYRLLLGTVVGIAIPTAFSFAVNPSVYSSYILGIQAHQGPLIWATPTLGTMLRMYLKTPSTLVQAFPAILALVVSSFLWMRWRKYFVWEQHGTEVLIVSAMTSLYSWAFDWVILLPAVLPILICFCRNRSNHSWWIISSVAIQGILLIQFAVQRDYIVTAWFPFAVAVLYWSHKKKCCWRLPPDSPPAELLN